MGQADRALEHVRESGDGELRLRDDEPARDPAGRVQVEAALPLGAGDRLGELLPAKSRDEGVHLLLGGGDLVLRAVEHDVHEGLRVERVRPHRLHEGEVDGVHHRRVVRLEVGTRDRRGDVPGGPQVLERVREGREGLGLR